MDVAVSWLPGMLSATRHSGLPDADVLAVEFGQPTLTGAVAEADVSAPDDAWTIGQEGDIAAHYLIVCGLADPNRGNLNSSHFRGIHVPVEEPSTASEADIGK